MVIANDQLLTWARLANNSLATVTNEMFPGGLDDLSDYSSDDIKDAVKNFRNHTTAARRFNVSVHSTKRLVQLTLWVKDKIRVGHDTTFPDGTTQAQFVAALEEAQQRDKIRQERKKNAEALSTLKIDPALKSSTGWDSWTDATRAALSIAYGSKGVPLLYVIRANDAPRLIFNEVDEHGNIIVPTWEEMAIDDAPLAGLDYEADRKTVHSFILNNVAEDSDAHAYIYPLVGKNNGRLDWMALDNCYENEATIQARVNQANKVWDMLVYKNERAQTFEAFSRKLTKSLQHFEKAGREKHDGDVIDWIWGHVQNAELSQHMSALKVAQSFDRKTSRQILQEIAKEIPNISKGSNFQPRVSEVHRSDDFTFDGDAPSNGALTPDGKLFLGTYSYQQWKSEDVTPFRVQIQELREKHGKGPNRARGNGNGYQGTKGPKGNDNKRKVDALKKNAELTLETLHKKKAELLRNLSAMKSQGEGGDEAKRVPFSDDTKEPGNDNAGDAFGGKNSMKKKKNE